MLAMTAPAGPGARLGGMSEPGRAKSRKGPLCGCGSFLAATPAAADRSDLDTFANAAGDASHQDGPARWRARFFCCVRRSRRSRFQTVTWLTSLPRPARAAARARLVTCGSAATRSSTQSLTDCMNQ
jgi:hypothetical protein